MADKKPTSRRIRKTSRSENGEKAKKPQANAQPEGTADEIIRASNEAVQALAQSLTNIATSLQERQSEHTQKYYAALMTAAPQDEDGGLAAAYQKVLDAVASQDATRIADAQKSYVELMSEMSSHMTEHSDTATQDYMTDCQDLMEEAQSHGQDQYFQYIDTLRDVLNKASGDDLPPATLSLVIQGMASAAVLSQGLFPPSE
ncbi:hypothetical protein [uncultured Tateyamaria sp.]|uniref:hypothetical protein n=1 Tax=uncultured Tateyamaria sp. TaxID=455651 RepID=UPI0026261A1A|nr:hypothetical protein [uncultured Tateyamaria sp.]